MTKLKSKKMTKSTFAIIIMAIAMVAMLAFGGTYAYFTAQANTMESSEFTVGKVLLTEKAGATVSTTGTILPGDKLVTGGLTYTNASTVDTYVAVVVTFKIGNADATAEEVEALGFTFPLKEDGWALTTDSNKQVYVATREVDDAAVYTVAAGGELVFTTDDIKFEKKEHFVDGVFQGQGESVQGKVITMSITAYQTQAKGLTPATNDAAGVWGAMKTALTDNSITA